MATWASDDDTLLFPAPASVDVAIGGQTSDAPFFFDADTLFKLVGRWFAVVKTPTSTVPAMKLRAETGSPPADDSYPLLLLQDQNQTNLAKWEASGSIDLIRHYLKNAGKITFQSEVPDETQQYSQYTCLFEKDGDFYLAVNAWWDPEEGQTGAWKRRDPSRTAYLMVVWAKHDVDPPANNPSGPMWYVCPPGQPDPISNVWQGLGGWLTGLLVTEDRNLVLGGANLEVDGYGNPPHGRFIHVALEKDPPASRTVIQRNASYYGANQWGLDAPDKPCAALGFLDDGSVHYWYHGPTGVPFYTADWAERMSLTAAGLLTLSGGLNSGGAVTIDEGAGYTSQIRDEMLEFYRNGISYIRARGGADAYLRFATGGTTNRWEIMKDGTLRPYEDSTYDIGSSIRYVANIFADTYHSEGSAGVTQTWTVAVGDVVTIKGGIITNIA